MTVKGEALISVTLLVSSKTLFFPLFIASRSTKDTEEFQSKEEFVVVAYSSKHLYPPSSSSSRSNSLCVVSKAMRLRRYSMLSPFVSQSSESSVWDYSLSVLELETPLRDLTRRRSLDSMRDEKEDLPFFAIKDFFLDIRLAFSSFGADSSVISSSFSSGSARGQQSFGTRIL